LNEELDHYEELFKIVLVKNILEPRARPWTKRCVGYIFLSNDLFLSVESFKKNYINCNSNITKYHDNNNYLIIIKYYFIYHDNNIYINNTNTYSKNKNFIIT
jgi:hypothetical protein